VVPLLNLQIFPRGRQQLGERLSQVYISLASHIICANFSDFSLIDCLWKFFLFFYLYPQERRSDDAINHFDYAVTLISMILQERFTKLTSTF